MCVKISSQFIPYWILAICCFQNFERDFGLLVYIQLQCMGLDYFLQLIHQINTLKIYIVVFKKLKIINSLRNYKEYIAQF